MHCPNCGKPIGDDQVFCGECGARVDSVQPAAQPPEPAAPEPVAPAAPTQPMPQQPAAAPPAYNDAAYQQQYAQQGYQQQYGQQAYQQQYAQPGYQQYATAQPPKKKTGLIITLVAVAVVFVVGAAIGGVLLLRNMSDGSGTTPPSTPSNGTTSSSSSSSSSGTSDDTSSGSDLTGYATPEDALAAEYPEDWVFALVDDQDDWQVWWAGPPNSEFVDEVIVEWTLDDTWLVTESYPLGDMEFPEDEAVNTVMMFLDYIMQDMPNEAQALCVPPFSEDPASASYSNGDFLSYEILEVTGEDDGTFWVHTSEEWRWGVEEYEYWVVPTELGYYISVLRPYGL